MPGLAHDVSVILMQAGYASAELAQKPAVVEIRRISGLRHMHGSLSARALNRRNRWSPH